MIKINTIDDEKKMKIQNGIYDISYSFNNLNKILNLTLEDVSLYELKEFLSSIEFEKNKRDFDFETHYLKEMYQKFSKLSISQDKIYLENLLENNEYIFQSHENTLSWSYKIESSDKKKLFELIKNKLFEYEKSKREFKTLLDNNYDKIISIIENFMNNINSEINKDKKILEMYNPEKIELNSIKKLDILTINNDIIVKKIEKIRIEQ